MIVKVAGTSLFILQIESINHIDVCVCIQVSFCQPLKKLRWVYVCLENNCGFLSTGFLSISRWSSLLRLIFLQIYRKEWIINDYIAGWYIDFLEVKVFLCLCHLSLNLIYRPDKLHHVFFSLMSWIPLLNLEEEMLVMEVGYVYFSFILGLLN